MYKLLKTSTSEGSVAEVWIDEDKKLCKKYYKINGITISGKKNVYTNLNVIRDFFETEVEWTKKLKSKWVPELYDYGRENDDFYIIQEYVGPNLMFDFISGTLYEKCPNIIEQVTEMFMFFKINNIYKFNNALSNMGMRDEHLVSFDFKYAKYRESHLRPLEINSINQWISKIDIKLKETLIQYI